MEENWCCLAISIIMSCTPEQAFQMFQNGKKPQVRLDERDYKAIAFYKQKNGMTWKDIGKLFGIQESTIFKRFKRYNTGRIAI